MQIPEELQKLSEKELKKILKNNIFQAKYIINKEYDRIDEIEAKIGKYFYRTKDKERISYRNIQRKDYYEPLTFDSLQRFRKENILNNINNWSYTAFKNWCVKQFNDVYGEEFVDEQDNYVIVHFPEVEISNSMEQSHTMRDIYLKFEIYSCRVCLKQLLRATLTDVEIRNNYTFSHVNNQDEVFDWSTGSFCFGETAISNLRDELNSRTKIVKNLRFFLEAIKEYLSWESLEGTPYRSINNVICDENLWINTSGEEEYDIDGGVSVVINNIQDFTYTFEYSENQYYTQLSDTTTEEIANILEQKYPEQLLPSLDGKSVRKNEVSECSYENERYIWFKDNYRPFKLINTESADIELPMKINSYFLRDVCSYIEEKFNTFLKQKKLNDYTKD